MDDPYDLDRFIRAQAPLIASVLAELRQGRKTSHWMWFVFPQIAGLGHSSMARRYALASLAEAEAFLADDLLGPRLRSCTAIVNRTEGRTAHAIFGTPDDLKFHSSMTLFALASPGSPEFAEALSLYFDGRPDPRTVALVEAAPPSLR